MLSALPPYFLSDGSSPGRGIGLGRLRFFCPSFDCIQFPAVIPSAMTANRCADTSPPDQEAHSGDTFRCSAEVTGK